jgi:hypothetical protein
VRKGLDKANKKREDYWFTSKCSAGSPRAYLEKALKTVRRILPLSSLNINPANVLILIAEYRIRGSLPLAQSHGEIGLGRSAFQIYA